MRIIFRGRGRIWWGWRVMLVAPRIVNDVSYVTRIQDEILFTWQAQYLVRLEGDACCSAHCKWRLICHGYQSWESFFVVGAAFGDLGVSLFVAGAVFGEIWVDSRSVKRCNFHYKMRLRSAKGKLGERAGARWRVHVRIMLGSCSNRPRIVNDVSAVFGEFLLDFGMQFCVAGAVFGEVGGWCLLLRAL